ncbi:protein of unknown function [Agrobacterium pusense]|jgi:hypothetical protein|uniref:Uncharacterized protein n=1 Tax=Agrobacterium pusense TaxID=648995 RepID=U4QFZ5_9HYPH|nr:protein of unknown function [Agrobacterium pusense]
MKIDVLQMDSVTHHLRFGIGPWTGSFCSALVRYSVKKGAQIRSSLQQGSAVASSFRLHVFLKRVRRSQTHVKAGSVFPSAAVQRRLDCAAEKLRFLDINLG